MAMKIITGYTGEKHITPADDACFYRGLFGDGNVVLPVGGQLEPKIQSATEVSIADGGLVMQGRLARNDLEVSLPIANGTQGMYRNDLIVARYTKDIGNSVESIELNVITGTAASGTAVDPEYNTGDIDNGETRDFPLYRVKLNGITIETVETLWQPAVIPVECGGTNAENAKDARANLGLGSVATEDIVPIAKGGTGKTTASGARSALGLGDVATEDIVPISKGGTGKTTASGIRTAIGLGSVATEDVVPISKGGTGKTTASGARTALELERTFETPSLWTENNVDSSSSDASLVVIPFLKMCLLRAHIKPKQNFTAFEQYGVVTIPEAYRPSYTHALSVYCGGRMLVKARITGGEGRVYVTSDTETNYEMYITGMWYYS